MDHKTYSFTVTRNAATQDPMLVVHWAIRQAQAEMAMHEVIQAEQLTPDEANFYYRTEEGFHDLHVWANSREDLRDVLDILEGRYGHDEYEVDEHARGEA